VRTFRRRSGLYEASLAVALVEAGPGSSDRALGCERVWFWRERTDARPKKQAASTSATGADGFVEAVHGEPPELLAGICSLARGKQIQFLCFMMVLNCVAPLGVISNQVLNFIARSSWWTIHGGSARRHRMQAPRAAPPRRAGFRAEAAGAARK